jgi:hypothetical protein
MRASRISWLAALALGAVLVCNSAIQEAEGGTPGGKPGEGGGASQERMAQVMEYLGLSAEQKARFFELQRAHYQKWNSPDGQSNITPEQRTEQFRQLRAAFEQKLMDSQILTDEQFAKWKEFQSQRFTGSGKAGGAPKRVNPAPDKLAHPEAQKPAPGVSPAVAATSAAADPVATVVQRMKHGICVGHFDHDQDSVAVAVVSNLKCNSSPAVSPANDRC